MLQHNQTSWKSKQLASLTLVVLAYGLGCTRGKAKTQPKAAGDAGNRTHLSVGQKGTADPWTAGQLPPIDPSATPQMGGEVTVQMYSDPPSLNTIVDSDWWAARITDHLLYQSLVGVDAYDDPQYRFKPELAESWEISDDKLVYTFHLRRGVKFHDGTPFSARDVMATYAKILDETTKAAHIRSYLEELESYTAPDDFTVVFKWKKPYFLALDTPFSDVGIQPAHMIEKMSGTDYNQAAKNSLNRHPVGTGPFKFVEWKSDQRVVYARNEMYWGRKAYLDKLIFRIVKDPTVGPLLAEKGKLDVVTSLLPEDWASMGERSALVKRFNRSLFHDASYSWIGWNEKRPFFVDAKVRRALTLLIDRAGFRNSILHGLSLPTTCHFYYRSPACDPAIKRLPYDPVAAGKLLDSAGWTDHDGDGVRDKDGIPFRFTFMTPASSVTLEQLATLMKESFKRAGIDMSIQKVEWAAFTKRLREHSFDACSLVWGGGPRGEPSQIWHSRSSKGGSNYISYANAEVDGILEKARVEFDADKRNVLYRRFQAILHQEQPYTFLWVPAKRALINKQIRGVKANLIFWQFQDWWIATADAKTPGDVARP